MNIPAIGIGPLGSSEWSVGGLGTSVPSATSTDVTSTGSGASGGFSNALTSAISSLDDTQATATQAAQAVATGQSTDPTAAVTAVENASLSMDFASQIRNQLDTVATTMFQTQL